MAYEDLPGLDLGTPICCDPRSKSMGTPEKLSKSLFSGSSCPNSIWERGPRERCLQWQGQEEAYNYRPNCVATGRPYPHWLGAGFLALPGPPFREPVCTCVKASLGNLIS